MTRLQNLSITWDAPRPPQLSLRWGATETPYGAAIGVVSGHGLCALGFADQIGQDAASQDLLARWPNASVTRDDTGIAPLVEQAIALRGRLHVMGTPFQHKVWRALLDLPLDGTATYGDIAARIGSPRAAQAVGTAVGANPLSVVIPCHRILPKSGGTGAYHWGATIKQLILAQEAARFG